MAEKHLRFLKKRTVWLLAIFGLLYLSIAGRLFYIQVLNNEHYREFAQDLRVRQIDVSAARGSICDRVGRQLAINVPTCSIYAHPNKIEDKEIAARRLAELTGMDYKAVVRLIDRDTKFIYLLRQVALEMEEPVKKAKLPYAGVLREPKRVYPSGAVAAHVLGFTDIDGRGIEGIEHAADKLLTGTDGYVIAEIDLQGRIIPETRRGSRAAVNGNDVVLTIDAYLQHVTEEALNKSFIEYKALGAAAIVMDPYTGEILALANCPTYNPNDRRSVTRAAQRNRALVDLYEPGSTLKAITIAIGLEEGMTATETVATCTSSGMQIGKRRIHCSLHEPYESGHGAVDMYKIIRHSCNIGASTVALRIGPDKMYSYLRAFGLLDRPGSGLPGEAVAGLSSPDKWPAIKLANIGFGQGIAVSPLQMACAYSVIANGGELVRPQIIREVRDSKGRVVQAFSPEIVRRVISEQTARSVTDMLIGCVDEGTGKTSKIDGYSVAGKTGSAQKASASGRGYAAGRYVASFMGFVPAGEPRIVICVVVDEPKGTHWGATAAAPVFKEIAQKAMWYLRVPPDQPIEQPDSTIGDDVNVRKTHDRLGAGHIG